MLGGISRRLTVSRPIDEKGRISIFRAGFCTVAAPTVLMIPGLQGALDNPEQGHVVAAAVLIATSVLVYMAISSYKKGKEISTNLNTIWYANTIDTGTIDKKNQDEFRPDTLYANSLFAIASIACAGVSLYNNQHNEAAIFVALAIKPAKDIKNQWDNDRPGAKKRSPDSTGFAKG